MYMWVRVWIFGCIDPCFIINSNNKTIGHGTNIRIRCGEKKIDLQSLACPPRSRTQHFNTHSHTLTIIQLKNMHMQ